MMRRLMTGVALIVMCGASVSARADLSEVSEMLGIFQDVVSTAQQFDQSYYDADGYDENGYDADGYDAEGYDAYGYDTDGYDADGYDENGYDADGNHWEDE